MHEYPEKRVVMAHGEAGRDCPAGRMLPRAEAKGVPRRHPVTRRRLMLIRLLLREYRLREGRDPDTLEPLNLQELALDPFSGQPFLYHPSGASYVLQSVGADGKGGGRANW